MIDNQSDTESNIEFNAEVLEQIVEQLPPGMAQQLFDKLTQECSRLLAILKDDSLNVDDTASAAHEFKGMLLNFGLVRASSIAAEIEYGRKPVSEITMDVQRLETAVAQGTQQAQSVLNNSGS